MENPDQMRFLTAQNLILLNSVGASQQNSTNTSDAEMNFEIKNPAKKQKLSPNPNFNSGNLNSGSFNSAGSNYNSSPASPSESNHKLAPFIHKMELLIKNNENVFWSEDGKFMVIDGIRSDQFSTELERVGLSNKHESFIRQMNTYGFRKEEYHPSDNNTRIKFPNQVFAYFNKYFTRDFKDLQAVHSTGKRKPIQQERETVTQLQKHTNSQSALIESMKNELKHEKLKGQALQGFVSQLANDSRVCDNVQNEIYRFLATVLQSGNGNENDNGNNNGNSGNFINSRISAQITSNFTPPMSISPQTFPASQNINQNLNRNLNQNLNQNLNLAQNLSQNFTQNLPTQNHPQIIITQNSARNIPQQNVATLLPSPSNNLQNLQALQNLQIQNLQLLNHPLNISIFETSMQPQKVQSTEENQNIQVTENLTPQTLQQLQLLNFLAQQQQQQHQLRQTSLWRSGSRESA